MYNQTRIIKGGIEMIQILYVLAAVEAVVLSFVAFYAHLRGAYGAATALLFFAGCFAIAGASGLLHYGEYGIWYSLSTALAFSILTIAEGIECIKRWVFRPHAASPP